MFLFNLWALGIVSFMKRPFIGFTHFYVFFFLREEVILLLIIGSV